MVNITLKPKNKPTKPGFYFIQRPNSKQLVNSIQTAVIIRNSHYNSGELYLFIGEMSQFPLDELEEGCLWSDEVVFYLERTNEG